MLSHNQALRERETSFKRNIALHNIVTAYLKSKQECATMKDDMCDTHPAEVASMYCTGCHTGVCRLCLCKGTGRHVGHVVIPMEQKQAIVKVCVITMVL